MAEEPHSTSSGLAAAEADLAAAMSGRPPASPAGQPPAAPPPAEPTPAPEPPPAAAPAPEPPAPAPEPPAAAPPGGDPPPAPAPPEPPAAPEPGVQDPAAKRYLEMHGGNVEAALAKALKDNNRLAALHREHPEAFQPGAPADPNQPSVDPTVAPELFEVPAPPPVSEPAAVELDPQVVAQAVNERVYADPNAKGLIDAYMTNQALIEGNPQTGSPGLVHQIQELAGKIDYETRKMNDEDLAPDDIRKGEIESKVLRMQTQLGLLQQERSRMLLENRDYDERFRSYRSQVEQAVTGEMTQTAESEAYTQYEAALEQQEYQKTLSEWPTALQKVMAENNIPPEQAEDFTLDATRAFQAALGDPNTVIEDIYGFLAPVGKELAARLDRYHRVRAGQYATGAAARAATPSPPTGPGTPAPPTEPATSPEEAMANATLHLRQRLRTG